ncbi:MAG: rRNA maturation RNase YbeY [Planctomycetes bacterium]|nr:rRNA maturation RNase YbeY [Planctomycetota bacterium]
MSTAQAADESGSTADPGPQSTGDGDADAVPLLTADISLTEPLIRRIRHDADDPLHQLNTDRLLSLTLAAAQCAGIDAGSIDVQITDDEEMSRLHEQYLGIPGTTDVITFDLNDEEADESVDESSCSVCTQIIVCADVAFRESLRRNHNLNHEVLLYIVHGLLHCLGYDDHDPQQHDAMHDREDEILQGIGVGRVYCQPGEDASDEPG